MRIPLAAKTLTRQVAEQYPDAVVEYGEADGFRVHRTITFKGDEVVAWLRNADLALTLDPRVQGAVSGDDAFEVTFVGDARADSPLPEFPLSEVAAISEEAEEEEEGKSIRWEDDTVTREELSGTPVKDLREMFPEYADYSKKDLIDALLADQG